MRLVPVLATRPSIVALPVERCLVFPQLGDSVARFDQLLFHLHEPHLVSISLERVLPRSIVTVLVGERLPCLHHQNSHGL